MTQRNIPLINIFYSYASFSFLANSFNKFICQKKKKNLSVLFIYSWVILCTQCKRISLASSNYLSLYIISQIFRKDNNGTNIFFYSLFLLSKNAKTLSKHSEIKKFNLICFLISNLPTNCSFTKVYFLLLLQEICCGDKNLYKAYFSLSKIFSRFQKDGKNRDLMTTFLLKMFYIAPINYSFSNLLKLIMLNYTFIGTIIKKVGMIVFFDIIYLKKYKIKNFDDYPTWIFYIILRFKKKRFYEKIKQKKFFCVKKKKSISHIKQSYIKLYNFWKNYENLQHSSMNFIFVKKKSIEISKLLFRKNVNKYQHKISEKFTIFLVELFYDIISKKKKKILKRWILRNDKKFFRLFLDLVNFFLPKAKNTYFLFLFPIVCHERKKLKNINNNKITSFICQSAKFIEFRTNRCIFSDDFVFYISNTIYPDSIYLFKGAQTVLFKNNLFLNIFWFLKNANIVFLYGYYAFYSPCYANNLKIFSVELNTPTILYIFLKFKKKSNREKRANYRLIEWLLVHYHRISHSNWLKIYFVVFFYKKTTQMSKKEIYVLINQTCNDRLLSSFLLFLPVSLKSLIFFTLSEDFSHIFRFLIQKLCIRINTCFRNQQKFNVLCGQSILFQIFFSKNLFVAGNISNFHLFCVLSNLKSNVLEYQGYTATNFAGNNSIFYIKSIYFLMSSFIKNIL